MEIKCSKKLRHRFSSEWLMATAGVLSASQRVFCTPIMYEAVSGTGTSVAVGETHLSYLPYVK